MWLRPPRRVLLLLVGVTVLLGVTLAWLGWRLLEQDRALESQRLRGRLEDVADRVAAELRQQLDAASDTLDHLATLTEAAAHAAARRRAKSLGPDAAILVLTPGAVQAYPPGRLAYHPIARTGETPTTTIFARAESLGFRARDYAGASATLRPLTASQSTAVRAGALLRLGRTRRKAGHLDLVRGRWLIDRAAHEFYAGEVRRWVDAGRAARLDSAHATSLELAAGATALFEWWRRGDQQITAFTEGEVGGHDWSPAGRLLVIRTRTASDLVLITPTNNR